ncbi:ribonuclease HII [Staphylococcus lutrae]|uniref:Ribonuclease HII n=1 Tax=Staphylococcus lutrae TaxID=155085 RepID=A0AAC9RSK7_9STAP|nr:ribonuclease HII [Staphylococcus lutrae]ARJ51688.1 ribonuclease HII [Staphylococcus lutrae]PNZ39042.1 ribonuclease HII [Staphylococcus lutrae]
MAQVRTVKEIKEALQKIETLEQLYAHPSMRDTRKGVQRAFSSRIKQLEKVKALQQSYQAMCQFEEAILNQDPQALICGIDEVGRGPLAGPVVASAVILQAQHQFIGINDSKQLSSAKRIALDAQLKAHVLDWQIGMASPEEIDTFNIYEATKLAMYRAVQKLRLKPTHYLIDAMTLEGLNAPQQAIIKGDAKSVSIAAASIIAKVYRDQLMVDYDQQYPGYDFSQNAGYGTKNHLEGLKIHGITPIHRRSFEPIKSMCTRESD